MMDMRDANEMVDAYSSDKLFGIPCSNFNCHNAIASTNKAQAINDVRATGWGLHHVFSTEGDLAVYPFCPFCSQLKGDWVQKADPEKGLIITLSPIVDFDCVVALKVSLRSPRYPVQTSEVIREHLVNMIRSLDPYVVVNDVEIRVEDSE